MTAEAYERMTGKKYTKIITMFRSLGEIGDDTDNLMEDLIEIETGALYMAYCMIQEAKHKGYNQDFNLSAEEWIGEVGALSSNELKGVLALAVSIFPRKV